MATRLPSLVPPIRSPNAMNLKLCASCWLVPAMLLLASACRQEVAAAPMAQKGPVLQPFQEELLRLAFRAASAFPLEPHAKNRSRAQEVAVVGCFELDAPQLALEFAHGIADWRRGSAYADYACYCARHDGREQALDYVKRAETFVKELARDVSTQEWRRDLIMMKLARACMLLGDQERADAFAAGIEAASTHAVDEDWARTAADRANMTKWAKAYVGTKGPMQPLVAAWVKHVRERN